MRLPYSLPVLAFVLAACTTPGPAPRSTPVPDGPSAASPVEAPSTGILVMAHGGDPAWNASVDAALRPLRETAPLALAFGMADRTTLQAAVDSLADRGVERVAVVRMFLSGRSFEDQTLYLLGLSPEAPAVFLHHGGHGGHGAPGDDASGPPPPVNARGLTVATHTEGLMDWGRVGTILLERARAEGAAPGSGGVLLLGHGMGDDAQNRGVLDAMDAASAELRRAGLGPVAVETLREDWPDARARAEVRIRSWISAHGGEGVPVVVPFRLSGFGPYAEVLEGLEYRPADGLLPHPAVADWVEETARAVACSHDWTPPTGLCGE